MIINTGAEQIPFNIIHRGYSTVLRKDLSIQEILFSLIKSSAMN